MSTVLALGFMELVPGGRSIFACERRKSRLRRRIDDAAVGGGFGRGTVVGPKLRQWSIDSGRAVVVTADAHVFVGLDLEAGVEQDQVIEGVADQLVALHAALANVPRTTDEAVPDEAKA